MSTLPLTAPDLICDLDLDQFGAETTSDLQSLIQDVTHLLIELPGTNPDDPKRGIGVALYLSGTETLFRTMPALIVAQLNEDPRIDDTKCNIREEPDGTFTVQISIAVSAKVLSLEFVYSSSAGLVLNSVQGI